MRLLAASGLGRETLLGVLSVIGDAARLKVHSWRRVARVDAW